MKKLKDLKACVILIGSTSEALKSWQMKDILFRHLSIGFEKNNIYKLQSLYTKISDSVFRVL